MCVGQTTRQSSTTVQQHMNACNSAYRLLTFNGERHTTTMVAVTSSRLEISFTTALLSRAVASRFGKRPLQQDQHVLSVVVGPPRSLESRTRCYFSHSLPVVARTSASRIDTINWECSVPHGDGSRGAILALA
jgi:hypothetical protein